MDGQRLRVQWQKGRNYFSSFFTELTEVRKSMDPAAFPEWCLKELGISLGVIVEASDILRGIDAKIAKRDLAPALAAVRQKQVHERALRKQEKDRIKVEKEQQRAAVKKEKKRLHTNKLARIRRRKKKEQAKLIQLAAE